jgi:hypothetical protein
VIYSKFLGNGKLREYVIFGRYKLTKYGDVVVCDEEKEIPGMPIVCTSSKFNKIYSKARPDGWCSWEISYYAIPSEKDSCPCCTKRFTIEDVQNGRFGAINGKIAHSECAKQYQHERMIDEIIHQIMEVIYVDGLTFDSLPNGSCNEPCCAHLPWFLCHTPDGDIEIGWGKETLSIKWKDNFKPFDMSIFDSEDVPKGERFIHAFGKDKAREYIKKVKDIVNSNPKKIQKKYY